MERRGRFRLQQSSGIFPEQVAHRKTLAFLFEEFL
jgi:hypothetical protein